MKTLTIDDCRGVAARIWCDPDYSHMVMDVYLCEMISQMLFVESNKQKEDKIVEEQTMEQLAKVCKETKDMICGRIK